MATSCSNVLLFSFSPFHNSESSCEDLVVQSFIVAQSFIVSRLRDLLSMAMANDQDPLELTTFDKTRRQQDIIEDDLLFAASTVPERYRGTTSDKNEMRILGKAQVLRRNFKFPTMLAFASTVLVAWEILPVISVYALQNGGTPIVFWGLIAGIIGMTFVYASLAEMASMFPTAGGQYRALPPMPKYYFH